MHVYNEQEDRAELSQKMAALKVECTPTTKAVMFQYLAGAIILTIGLVMAVNVPLPRPHPATLWPILLAVLICKIWIGLRAARLTAVVGIAAIFAFGINTFADGVLDREDLAQLLWCSGWSGVVWGMAALSRSRAESRFERLAKNLSRGGTTAPR